MTPDTAQLLAAHGLRCTRQRKAIYDALAHSRHHPTAEDLFHLVTNPTLTDAPPSPMASAFRGTSRRGSSGLSDDEDLTPFPISLATVYNTLEAFCQAGLAHKLPGAGDNGSARYDAARGNHLHLRCQKTGAVADAPDDLSQQVLDRLPPDLLAQLESHLGFKINQVQIELVGTYLDRP